MNWDAVGAVGEVLGATAVIVTLLYLAVQTRQTRIAVENGGSVATNEAHSRFRLAIMENPELVAILAKANNGSELTDSELIQFRALNTELFLACVIGAITANDESPRTEVEYLIDFFELNPSSVKEWRRQHYMNIQLAPRFCAEIDRRLDSDGAAQPVVQPDR
jgi:hypothetical protein